MIKQDKLKNGLTRVHSDKGQISIDGSAFKAAMKNVLLAYEKASS